MEFVSNDRRTARDTARRGWVRLGAAGCGRVWPGVAGCSRFWPVLAGFSWVWLGLAGFGRVWPGLPGFVWVWSVVPLGVSLTWALFATYQASTKSSEAYAPKRTTPRVAPSCWSEKLPSTARSGEWPRPGFTFFFVFLGAGGRLPKARRGFFSLVGFIMIMAVARNSNNRGREAGDLGRPSDEHTLGGLGNNGARRD